MGSNHLGERKTFPPPSMHLCHLHASLGLLRTIQEGVFQENRCKNIFKNMIVLCFFKLV